MLVRCNGYQDTKTLSSVADEDARSLQREYRTLVKERSRSSNRIRGLLASQGLVAPGIDGRFPEWLGAAKLWDGSAIPSGMRARVGREFTRWRFTHDQVRALEKERRDRTKDETNQSLKKVRALYALKGIGLGAAWTWALEFITWRNFRNGKEVGALSGLAPTPYQSGPRARKVGIVTLARKLLVALWRYVETSALPEGAVLKS